VYTPKLTKCQSCFAGKVYDASFFYNVTCSLRKAEITV